MQIINDIGVNEEGDNLSVRSWKRMDYREQDLVFRSLTIALGKKFVLSRS